MSAVDKLKTGYGAFFVGCAGVAVSPYLLTYRFFSGNRNENPGIGIAACAVFTFIIPVLPILTGFTLKVAAIAAVIGLASLLFTVPAAMTADGCSGIASTFRAY